MPFDRATFLRRLETALRPGDLIEYDERKAFVSGLRPFEDQLQSLTADGRAAEAAELYEQFINRCIGRYEAVVDAHDCLLYVIRDLIIDWASAREAAGLDRRATARRLADFLESSPFDIGRHLETRLCQEADDAILDALRRLVRNRLDELDRGLREEELSWGPPVRHAPAQDRYVDVLMAIYEAQHDVDAYLELARRDGLTPDHCLTVSDMLVEMIELDEALEWVDRGLELAAESNHDSSKGMLNKKKASLLEMLGRDEEALQAAWTNYRDLPSAFTWDELMDRVPDDERDAWRKRALDAAEDTALPGWTYPRVCVNADAVDRLAELVANTSRDELTRWSHTVGEPVAQLLEAQHPTLAAQTYAAQGLRIVDKGKSKYYRKAVEYLARARRLWLSADHHDRWHALEDNIRDRHDRKWSFMPLFEKVCDGELLS